MRRFQLLWRFVKLLPQAEKLEIECREVQQKLNDLMLSEQVHPGHKEKELQYQTGYVEGVRWCIKRFW